MILVWDTVSAKRVRDRCGGMVSVLLRSVKNVLPLELP